jgi:hypothetical protein
VFDFDEIMAQSGARQAMAYAELLKNRDDHLAGLIARDDWYRPPEPPMTPWARVMFVDPPGAASERRPRRIGYSSVPSREY